MYSAWLRTTFRRVLKFLQIKEGQPDFWGWGSNFAECLNYLVPPSLFQFWKFCRPNFFAIRSIPIYCAWFRSTFRRVLKFVQIKDGRPNFCGEPILQNVWIIWSHFLFSNFKSFLDRNLSSFITFQSILQESGRLSSESWNFLKLKRRDLISGGRTNFAECLKYFVPSSVFEFWKFYRPKFSVIH